jgi:hypothetical protein
MRRAAKQDCGITYLLLAATHTHSGPVVAGPGAAGGLPEWQLQAKQKILKAIAEAHGRAVEARLGFGYGHAVVGYNRRLVNLDGSVTMLWENETRAPYGPVDPTVAVLRVDSREGKPIAVLVNYAAHPVIFGQTNLKYSADYPAVVIRKVERAFDSKPVCLFFQGACGDINAYYAGVPQAHDPPAKRDWVGSVLGDEAVRAARLIETRTPDDPVLQFTEEQMRFRLRWMPDDPAMLLREMGLTLPSGSGSGRPPLEMPVTSILINRQIALATMPGEPFLEFQTEWRRRCPVRNSLFVGYANAHCGYLPTIRTAAEGGYGSSDSSTWIETGAGERMLDWAVIKTYEMLRQLTNTPKR